MKADHGTLMKAAELGILRSMPDFLEEPLSPGRLKRRFMEVGMLVDFELRKIYKTNPNFFIDNKEECSVYLEKFGLIMGNNAQESSEIHIASVVGFCLMFLENSKSIYPAKLYVFLADILDYYERADNMDYSDLWKGRNFYEEWEELKNNGN
jgi:hypothetical protein